MAAVDLAIGALVGSYVSRLRFGLSPDCCMLRIPNARDSMFSKALARLSRNVKRAGVDSPNSNSNASMRVGLNFLPNVDTMKASQESTEIRRGRIEGFGKGILELIQLVSRIFKHGRSIT